MWLKHQETSFLISAAGGWPCSSPKATWTSREFGPKYFFFEKYAPTLFLTSLWVFKRRTFPSSVTPAFLRSFKCYGFPGKLSHGWKFLSSQNKKKVLSINKISFTSSMSRRALPDWIGIFKKKKTFGKLFIVCSLQKRLQVPWLNSRICFDKDLEISKMPKDSQGLLGKETACGSQEEKDRAPLMLLESTEVSQTFSLAKQIAFCCKSHSASQRMNSIFVSINQTTIICGLQSGDSFFQDRYVKAKFCYKM